MKKEMYKLWVSGNIGCCKHINEIDLYLLCVESSLDELIEIVKKNSVPTESIIKMTNQAREKTKNILLKLENLSIEKYNRYI